jgi:hypothetical protein
VNEELARTDARGNFEVKTLPIGPKYVVYATAVNYGRSQQDLGPSSLTDRVELPPLVLDLTDKLLAGQVVDARDKPVAGVNVSFSGKNQPATSSILTDSQGRFSFKVCEGAIRVFASGPNGYANVSAQGGDTNLVLQLARNQTSGRVATSGKSLRNFSAFGLSTDTAPGKPLLLCLFDAEQPPSRRSVLQLAGRYEALRQKGIAVVGIQATAIPTRTWHAWTNSNPLPFPLGRAAAKSTATRWTSDVDSLPWLILRNASGTVAAEGFAIEQLDAQLKRVQ